ncbi:MAG TPA: cytochrome P450 [Acidimicrobiales bacterium]|nr:cytochrome P450 [Acidimicrobiales bacterium]
MQFDPYSEAFFEDATEIYRWLRDEAPVYHNEERGFWALSRYDDVLHAQRDWKTFSSTHGVSLDDLVVPGPSVANNMIVMDPPDHDRLRVLVSRAFTPRAISAFEPLVRAVEEKYLDRLDGAPEFDIVADFAAPFPVEVISAVLGVPDDERRQQIRHWTDEMLHREPGRPAPPRAAMEAAMSLGACFYELAQHVRVHPGDNMMSALVEASLDDVEVANFSVLLAAAGSETVTKLIGSGVVLFARNPDQWRKVLDDPAAIPGAVEEVLRYLPPAQYQGRYTVADAVFEGGTIPAESPVLLLTGAATRDERAYDRPDEFDITREHHIALGFGHGAHACIGAHLARLESRVAFEEIRKRWPAFSVDEAGLRRVTMSNVAGYVNVPVAVS